MPPAIAIKDLNYAAVSALTTIPKLTENLIKGSRKDA